MRDESVTGFLGGLNVFQDETVIRDSELTEAKNIILSVDGIEPRPGTLRNGGNGGDSKVLGLFGYYKADGTRMMLRAQGQRIKKNFASPTQLDATVFDAVANVNFVQARDDVFVFNGTNELRRTNGSTITTYTALALVTGLAVAPQGTTGAEPYSYRISAFNSVGEQIACGAVAITNGNAALNATNWNKVTWSAVSGAVGYNVWGRKATGLGETYLATVYTTQYDDKGQDDPSLVLIPPEGDTTSGIKCKFGCFAISRIFAAGDPNQPSRLYYGGVGTNIGNFSGSSEGGGYVDVFRNDGSIIRSILPFQGGVIIWKDNAIYKFSFNASGYPQLEEITRSFGGISYRACKHVENDVIFAARKDGRLAYYSLGNQENYSGSVLRTNELSIKIAKKLQDVNLQYLGDSCAFYFNNIYGCAVSKQGSSVNNRIWCLDTRFGAWVYWEGITPNVFATYVDTDGSEKLYYGDAATGYVSEMFRDERNDDDTAIDVKWATKSFNQKKYRTYKDYFTPVAQFKDVTQSGVIQGEIILDGFISNATFTVNAPDAGGAGVGAITFGNTLFGDAGGGSVAFGLSSDTLAEVDYQHNARSIKYAFRSNSKNARYKFLSIAHEYQLLEDQRLPSSTRSYVN